MFSKETYTSRRNVLKSKLDSGLILILGNDESPMNYKDNGYHFRQDSSFSYYFGLNRAGLTAVMDVDTGVDSIYGNQ